MRKFLKVFLAVFAVCVVLLCSVIPSFAYFADNNVTLVAPFSAVFSYPNSDKPYDFTYRTYSVNRIENNYLNSSDNLDVITGLGDSYINVRQHYSTINSQVYGYTEFTQPDVSTKTYPAYFSGIELMQPVIVHSPFTASDLGSVDIYYDIPDTTLNYGYQSVYKLYNFTTKKFDTFVSDAVGIDYGDTGHTTFNFGDAILGNLSADYVYERLSIVGSLQFRIVTFDNSESLTDVSEYGLKFRNLTVTPGKTYSDRGNRNDEYLQKIISTLQENQVIYKPIYVNPDTDFMGFVGKSVSSFFNAPLFGSDVFTLGNVFTVVIAIAIVVVFLKLFAGG